LKRIIFFTAVLIVYVVNAVFSISEIFIPDNVMNYEQDGKHYIIKAYTLPPGEVELESEFEQDGYKYTKENTDEEEIYRVENKDVEQSETDNSQEQLEYSDEDGYSGVLTIDNSKTTSKVKGYKAETYTVSDTQYFYNLPSRDLYTIPKSVSKDGVTLSFSTINWIEAGSGYTAKVTYSGTKSRQVPTGYTKTYIYSGTVTKAELESITYIVTYVGELIPIPYNPVPLVVGGSLGSGFAGLFLFFLFKKNTKIYNMQNGNYLLIGKTNVKTLSPTINLAKYKHKITTNVYRIVLSKSLANKLFEHEITISYDNEALKHTVRSCESDYTFDITIGG